MTPKYSLHEDFGVPMTKWILWGQADAKWTEKVSGAWAKYWRSKNAPKGNRIPFYARDTVQSMTFKKNTLKAEIEELENELRNKKGGKV